MDESLPAPELTPVNEWGYASNKHLYEWIANYSIAESQKQELFKEMDPKMAGTQDKVNTRKEMRGELYDSFERTMEKRAEVVVREGGGVWKEDPLSNEVDAYMKLNNTVE